MREFENMSYRQMLAKLGLPIRTVMSRFPRARKHLESAEGYHRTIPGFFASG
jgi:DNA-directed RNA polymerase specialized sigma24 family protein